MQGKTFAPPEKLWRPPFSTVADSPEADRARRQRRRVLILPREHGAWGLLLVPMITGAGLALRERPHLAPFLLLLIAALALFWLRTPVESLLGTSPIRAQNSRERREVWIVVGLLVKVALAALATLLWAGHNPYLWMIGATAAAAFVGQAFLRKLGRGARMLSEIVGTIGLTASAPAAYYVITHKFGTTGWILWLANLAFAGNQVHYVQLRIHTARLASVKEKLSRGWPFALGQFIMAIALALVCQRGWLPWSSLIAFAPILLRGWFYFLQKPAPLVVRRLGWNELAQAVVFCVLFIAAFALGR